jgi:hypothetical protein
MSLNETVSRLKDYWTMLFPESPMPADNEWALWMLEHDETQVKRAFTVLAQRATNGSRKIANEDLSKFVMGIIIRTQNLQQEKQAVLSKVSAPVAVTVDDNVGNRA